MPLSTFLNGRAVDQARGLQFLALSEQGAPLTLTSTSDSGGGATQLWAAGGTVPCRVDPLVNGSGGVTGGQIDERSTHLITAPAGTPVTTAGRFHVLSRGTFDVTATRDRTAQMTVEFEAVQIL